MAGFAAGRGAGVVQGDEGLGSKSSPGGGWREAELCDDVIPTQPLPALGQEVPEAPSRSSQPWTFGGPSWASLEAVTSYPVDGPPSGRGRASRREKRRPAPLLLRIVVILLALCTLCAAGGLVALREHPGWFAGLRNGAEPPPRSRPAPRSSRPATPHTLPPSTGLGGLVITALVPARAAGGSKVRILGTHLFGPGGYLVATFDGAPSPTSCPSETECIVTVPPPPPGTTSVTVRLETHTGMSNGLTFNYG